MNKEELKKEIKEVEDRLCDLKKQLGIIESEEEERDLQSFKNNIKNMLGKYYLYSDSHCEEYWHIVSMGEVMRDRIDGVSMGRIEVLKFTAENGVEEITHDPEEWIMEGETYTEISKSTFMNKLKEFTDKYLPKD